MARTSWFVARIAYIAHSVSVLRECRERTNPIRLPLRNGTRIAKPSYPLCLKALCAQSRANGSVVYKAKASRLVDGVQRGASVGGLVFSTLWVALIATWRFAAATLWVGAVMSVSFGLLGVRYLGKSPAGLGLMPDGGVHAAIGKKEGTVSILALPGAALHKSNKFMTLALGMALGLFAQIGLLAHLYSFLVPTFGEAGAGYAMSYATVCAMLMLLGVTLFGSGIGNATSLPPLIAQLEFAAADVGRTVALIVGLSQATFAFAPMAFGLVRESPLLTSAELAGASPMLFVIAGCIQLLAAIARLLGRQKKAAV